MEILTLSLGLPIGAALLGPDNVWWKPVVFSGVGSIHPSSWDPSDVLVCVAVCGHGRSNPLCDCPNYIRPSHLYLQDSKGTVYKQGLCQGLLRSLYSLLTVP